MLSSNDSISPLDKFDGFVLDAVAEFCDHPLSRIHELCFLAPMSYPGGKAINGFYHRIINEIPPHDLYIEPFLGNGAILRRKKPASLSCGVDSDPLVFARWKRHEIPDLKLYCCDGIEWLKHTFDLYQVASKEAGIAAESSGHRQRAGSPFCDIARVAGNAFVYADPPYLEVTRRSKRPPYRHELPEERHVELLSALQQLPCLVMISGYDSELYRENLKDWRVAEIPVMNRANEWAIECIWMNYAEPTELHDYSFLGSNKRERERLKRRARNLSRGLEQLPPLERRAIVHSILRQGI